MRPILYATKEKHELYSEDLYWLTGISYIWFPELEPTQLYLIFERKMQINPKNHPNISHSIDVAERAAIARKDHLVEGGGMERGWQCMLGKEKQYSVCEVFILWRYGCFIGWAKEDLWKGKRYAWWMERGEGTRVFLIAYIGFPSNRFFWIWWASNNGLHVIYSSLVTENKRSELNGLPAC